MSVLKESFFFRLINKLDISGNSKLFQELQSCLPLRILNSSFGAVQNLFGEMSDKSLIISNLSNISFFLVAILLISLMFADSSTIGMLAGIAILAFIACLALRKGSKQGTNPLDVPILLYIMLLFLSVAFSSLLFPAVKGFSKYVIYLSSYVVFFNIHKDKPKRAYYIVGIIATTVFIEALIAIHQNLIGVEELAGWQDTSNVNPEQIMTRVFGTLQPLNPNLFGGYLVAGFPCVIGAFFLSIIRKMPRLSIISLFAVGATLLAIIFTGSRGAYLGLAAILVAVMAISGHVIWHNFNDKTWLKRIWTYLIIIGVLGVIAVIIASPTLQHRILSIFAFREDSSNSFRMNVYISSFNMFLDNWLIGIGPGNEVFRLIYGHYMITAFDALSAYNIFLETAIECGIFGLFAFLWLITAIFLKGAKVVMSDENLMKKILISTCAVGILGMIVHGMVDTVFFRPQLQFIFWMYVAMLGAYLPKAE
ncbi:MAG: hypothetical protein GX568_01355 [Candidatus Gastranaerophilales bacterium]|nr:hypothetical protein [Candidatus Gastranaerophilales bacterium]